MKLSSSKDNLLEKPLQYIHPELYLILIKELEHFNLHPYDVKAGAISNQVGITVFLRYGENLSHMKEHYWDWKTIKEDQVEVKEYFHSTGEDIKKALIADYFKMMKP
ncbi:hypothetical protein LPB68_01310 [Paenibacillus crassostreae]|nr:hypothetical protein LPB68_01310 [Paenibacillus crassostreae]